nr:hypothetical protein [Streptomyces sp. NRRL S-646]
MYEVLLRGHERLVRRAELGGLKDRRDGRPEIGWWLFHQWVDQQPGGLAELLSAADTPGVGLGDLALLIEPEADDPADRNGASHRFAQYGLTTRLETPPDELDKFDIRLVDEGYLRLADEIPGPVPLHRLVSAAWELSADLGELAQQVTALGFQIRGDLVRRMDDIDHRLCKLRGRPTSTLGSPLSLTQPIADFLRIAVSGVPADDLPRRLERLGVDLDRVRKAVLAALPKVPGLVMKPKPGPKSGSAASEPEATLPTASPAAPRSPRP